MYQASSALSDITHHPTNPNTTQSPEAPPGEYYSHCLWRQCTMWTVMGATILLRQCQGCWSISTPFPPLRYSSLPTVSTWLAFVRSRMTPLSWPTYLQVDHPKMCQAQHCHQIGLWRGIWTSSGFWPSRILCVLGQFVRTTSPAPFLEAKKFSITGTLHYIQTGVVFSKQCRIWNLLSAVQMYLEGSDITSMNMMMCMSAGMTAAVCVSMSNGHPGHSDGTVRRAGL